MSNSLLEREQERKKERERKRESEEDLRQQFLKF